MIVLRVCIVLVSVLFASSSFSEARITEDAKIPKEEFFTLIESRIPARLCGISAFKTCFKGVNRLQCTLFMARALKGCSVGWRQQYQEKITQAEAIEIGDSLSSCATKKFQKTFFKNTKEMIACLKENKGKK